MNVIRWPRGTAICVVIMLMQCVPSAWALEKLTLWPTIFFFARPRPVSIPRSWTRWGQANCGVSLDRYRLAKDKVCFQNTEHGTNRTTLWGIEHHMALRPALRPFAPFGFDEADLVDGDTERLGDTCQVVAAVAANQLAIGLGDIQELGLLLGRPSKLGSRQQVPHSKKHQQKT